METLRLAFFAAVLALLNASCMSLDMIAHAEGKPPPEDPQGPPYVARPGYYALVPLVLPLDLITLPIQYFYFRPERDAAQQQQPPPPPQTY